VLPNHLPTNRDKICSTERVLLPRDHPPGLCARIRPRFRSRSGIPAKISPRHFD
jgi:hypothetical protein